jgi:hypothetical protein
LANTRARVNAELDEPVPDPLWDYLDAEGYVDDVELGLQSASQVAATVRRIRNATADRSERGLVREPGLPQAGEAARARIDALSAIYAAWASARPDVTEFRGTILARSTRLIAEATGTTANPASQEGTLAQGEAGAWVRWCYHADSPGGGGHDHVAQEIGDVASDGARRVIHLSYIEGRDERMLTVPTASVLGKLAKLADELSEEYRWRPSEATMFVLAGHTPEVFVYVGSAEVRYHERSATTRVTMTIDPSLNPDEVAGIYGRLRQRFHRPPLPRYQSTRRYRLAQFVGPHLQMRVDEPGSRRGRGRRPLPGPSGLATFIEPLSGYTWRGLRDSWNSLYGSTTDEDTGRAWRYDNDPNFIRDAKTAVSQLLFPGWTGRR